MGASPALLVGGVVEIAGASGAGLAVGGVVETGGACPYKGAPEQITQRAVKSRVSGRFLKRQISNSARLACQSQTPLNQPEAGNDLATGGRRPPVYTRSARSKRWKRARTTPKTRPKIRPW